MSNKNKNQQLIFAASLMVLLIIVLPNFIKKSASKAVMNKVSQIVSQEPAPAPVPPKETDKKEEIENFTDYTVEGKNDPLSLPEIFRNTASLLFTPKPENIVLPNLVASGVVWGGHTPQAIINGKIVKEGDAIEGVEILEIRKEGILAFFNGQEFTIPVTKPVISNINQLREIK
jgi:hypothetical protein